MQIPVEIRFKDIPRSPALETVIREQAEKLEQVCSDIISCRVTVEAPHRHQNKGRIYHVVVDVNVPGREIVVSHAQEDNHAHEDPYVAVNDSFRAATRRLKGYNRQRTGKARAAPEAG
ncbi:HPF/RaiA family ribosome-associated protein [Lentisalinibacter salinarum]|uniref:HPF/RaiA family ribosome-associated protein n=1 Tax=Lentisalinibacter salinarum TaxID=2992239 RepID=UPI003869816D